MLNAATDQTVLRIGIDDAPPIPLQNGDPTAGTFHGYEVDLLEQVALHLGRRVEYERARWSLIVDDLISGKLDAVCSAATVTKARERVVSFSVPYLHLKLALVQRQGPPELQTMTRMRFGVRCGTTAEDFLRATVGVQPEILSESNDDLYEALSLGRLDGVLDDSPIAMHFAENFPGLMYGGTYEGTEAAYAIMVAKDSDALRLELNSAISRLEEAGVLASLRERWFGAPAFLVA